MRSHVLLQSAETLLRGLYDPNVLSLHAPGHMPTNAMAAHRVSMPYVAHCTSEPLPPSSAAAVAFVLHSTFATPCAALCDHRCSQASPRAAMYAHTCYENGARVRLQPEPTLHSDGMLLPRCCCAFVPEVHGHAVSCFALCCSGLLECAESHTAVCLLVSAATLALRWHLLIGALSRTDPPPCSRWHAAALALSRLSLWRSCIERCGGLTCDI